MMSFQDNSENVKRIVLPSGKTIEVVSFDEELDRGMEELAADLGRLARANMADDVDRFVAALNADAIQPMDF